MKLQKIIITENFILNNSIKLKKGQEIYVEKSNSELAPAEIQDIYKWVSREYNYGKPHTKVYDVYKDWYNTVMNDGGIDKEALKDLAVKVKPYYKESKENEKNKLKEDTKKYYVIYDHNTNELFEIFFGTLKEVNAKLGNYFDEYNLKLYINDFENKRYAQDWINYAKLKKSKYYKESKIEAIKEDETQDKADILNQKQRINDLKGDLLQAQEDGDKNLEDRLKKDLESETEALKSMQDGMKEAINNSNNINFTINDYEKLLGYPYKFYSVKNGNVQEIYSEKDNILVGEFDIKKEKLIYDNKNKEINNWLKQNSFLKEQNKLSEANSVLYEGVLLDNPVWEGDKCKFTIKTDKEKFTVYTQGKVAEVSHQYLKKDYVIRVRGIQIKKDTINAIVVEFLRKMK